jgi:hypothetical protein
MPLIAIGLAALALASCGGDNRPAVADGSPEGGCAGVPRWESNADYNAKADPLSEVECDAARAALTLFEGASPGECPEIASGRVLADCEELAHLGGRAVEHVLTVEPPPVRLHGKERDLYGVNLVFEADGSQLMAYYDESSGRIVDGSWD